MIYQDKKLGANFEILDHINILRKVLESFYVHLLSAAIEIRVAFYLVLESLGLTRQLLEAVLNSRPSTTPVLYPRKAIPNA